VTSVHVYIMFRAHYTTRSTMSILGNSYSVTINITQFTVNGYTSLAYIGIALAADGGQTLPWLA